MRARVFDHANLQTDPIQKIRMTAEERTFIPTKTLHKHFTRVI